MKFPHWWDNLASSKKSFIIIFFGALATRLVGAYLGGIRADDSDHLYIQMAQSFLEGRGLSYFDPNYGTVYSWLPPGTSIFYLPWLYLKIDPIFALRWFFIFFGSFSVVLFFLLAKKIFSDRYAFLAAAIWVLYPPQWFWSTRISPHPFGTNMVVICLTLLVIAWERRLFWVHFLVGFLWALISLTRGEYTFGIAVLCVGSYLAFSAMNDRLKSIFCLMLGWGLVFSFWVVRNYRLHGHIVMVATNYADNFFYAYNPDYDFSGHGRSFTPEFADELRHEPNEVLRARMISAVAFAYMKAHPLRTVEIIIGNGLNFWRPWLSRDYTPIHENIVYVCSYLPIFILFVIGLFHLPWRDPFWVVCIGLFIYKFLIHIPFYIIVAFREGLMPLMILIAVLAIKSISESKKESVHVSK